MSRPVSTAHTAFAAHLPSAGSLLRRLALGVSAAEQRRRLAELDDAMLNDIGISREAARVEARRPAWDVPQSWLR